MAEFPLELQHTVADTLIAEFESLEGVEVGRERRHLALSTLRSLRLTHRYFSRATIVKIALFKNITLQASAAKIRRLKQTNFLPVAPFIRNVTLTPSLHTLDLDNSDLRNLIQDVRLRCRIPLAPLSYVLQGYVEAYWKGGVPVTESEITDECQAYRQRALEDEDLIWDGVLQREWIPVLRSLQSVQSIRLLSHIGMHPFIGHGESAIHADRFLSERQVIRESCSGYYSHFSETVLQCLSISKMQINALVIDCELASTARRWRRVSVPMLRTLEFTSASFWEQGTSEADARSFRILAVVHDIVRKTPKSIETLTIRRSSRIPLRSFTFCLWLSELLHNLASLSLEGVSISTPLFADEISELKALKKICLQNCLTTPTGQSWKPLFSEIRQHVNKVYLTFHDVWVGEGSQISFDHDTGSTSQYEDLQLAEQHDSCLFRYLANCGSWCQCLCEVWEQRD